MTTHDSSGSRLVYTSEQGRMADGGAVRGSDKVDKSKARRKNKARPTVPTAPKDGIVRISRSSKGRKGKGVTIITGVPLSPDELRKLAKTLKARCGSGGTMRGDVIEIQGDHRDTVEQLLVAKGYTVKRAGG